MSVGPILLVGVFIGWMSYRTQLDFSIRYQQEINQRVIEQVERLIRSVQHHLELTINLKDPVLQDSKAHRALISFLFNYQSDHFSKIFEELYLIDSGGGIQAWIAHEDGSSDSFNSTQSRSQLISRISDGNVYFGPVRFSQFTGEPFMVIGIPIPDLYTGKLWGGLFGEFRFKRIWELIQTIHRQDKGLTYILDRRKSVVAHPDPSVVLKREKYSHLTPQEGVAEGLNGNLTVIAHRKFEIGGNPYWMVTEYLLVEVLSLTLNTVTSLLTIILAILLGLIPLGLYIQKRILAPLETLAQKVQRMGRGDLDQRVVVDREDELGVLSEAFNQMSARLSETITSLHDQMQTAEAARADADKASQAKSEFLSAMSHEIRTPLNAIIGMAEVLSETHLSNIQKQYVDISRNAGETLLNIINDILDISKIEARHLELEHTAFDLMDIVENTCGIFAPQAHKKKIELACRIAPQTPLHLKGDPIRFRQVLSNLLSNAVKFTSAGNIHVDVTGRLEDVQPGGSRKVKIHVSVADTGMGVPADRLEAIFEPFTQVDASISRRHGGTGLGLAIAKNLVEMMGGRILVKTQSGDGTCFTFDAIFDVCEDALAKPEKSKSASTLHRVLVVDDHAVNRLIVRETLAEMGVAVTEVENGAQALHESSLALKRGEPFDLILLDRNMPSMNGFEVVEKLSQMHGQSETMAMMLTSHNAKGDMQRAEELGVQRCLVKPIRRSDLINIIQDSLSMGQNETAVTPDVPRDSIQQPLNILLAEDSEYNRIVVKAYLQNTLHRISVAENGQEAVEQALNQRFDLILMDIQLPIKDGYTAVREIRAFEKAQGYRTPIVAMTAFALEADVRKSHDAGCDRHLAKPVKKNEFLTAIHELTASASQKAPNQGDDIEAPPDEREGDAPFYVQTDPALLPVVPDFIQSMREQGRMVLAKMENQDFTGIRIIAHKMRGEGGTFGLPGVGEIGASLSAAVKAGQAEQLPAIIDCLFDYLDRARLPENEA